MNDHVDGLTGQEIDELRKLVSKDIEAGKIDTDFASYRKAAREWNKENNSTSFTFKGNNE